MKEKLGVFVTGGTFDKDYDLLNGELGFKKTHVTEMFKRGRSTLPISIHNLMMVDSLDMTDSQRLSIVESCETFRYKKILITHGLDTMIETARLIAKANLAKTIVLTGAMRPYKLGSSDGFFNLGSAVAFAQTLPHGVYIVMHGRYFRWDNVYKNQNTGYFEVLEDATAQLGIFVTGGTVDKDYDLLNGELRFKKTHVTEMFNRGRSTLPISIHNLMMVDSLDMTDGQRKSIVESCKMMEYERILITHGTDTMADTAKLIAKANLKKTIVLTGAMRPYKLGSSDGFFNLGSAVAFAQTLPYGVYIVMHGRYFNWHNVFKNRMTGYFEEVNVLVMK